MTVRLSKAKQLCTKSEYDLVLWSSHKHVQELTPSRLKQKIDRARKLRDKYRDLAKSQRREARGKQKPRRTKAASGNENTETKAQIFTESLERFEKALKKAERNASPGAKKKTTGKKTTTKKKTTTNKSSVRTKTSSRKTTAKKSQSKNRKSATSEAKAKPKKTTASSKGKKKADIISPAKSPARKPPTIGSEPTTGSPFGMLRTGATAEQESRATRRKKSSKHARPGTLKSQFARTNMDKIHGHVSAQTKRRQAKRDS